MSRHTAPRTRRTLGVLTAGAALAALLTTGAASAQDSEQPPLSCSEALQKLTAAQDAAVDPTGPGKPADGTVITATEAAQIQAVIAAAIDPAGPGNDDGVPPAIPDDEDTLIDESVPADTADGAEITPAEQDAIDGAESAATDPGGPGSPADGTVITAAEQDAIDDAKGIADTACKGAQGEPGPVTAPVSTVWCVLKPGVCAEVRLDAQGRLVAVIRQVNCPTDNLPAATGSRRGERVTVVSAPAPGSVTILPGTGGVPQAPAPTIVESDLPVTH